MAFDTKGKVFFITGFEKNCGKTTFLNYLLSKQNSHQIIFCATVGVDAKGKDFLSEDLKPNIKVKKGWKVLTNSSLLNNIKTNFIVNEVFDVDILGGKPVVLTLLEDCYVRLVSAGSNLSLLNIVKVFYNTVDKIFIDGSFDRITQISVFENSSFYYVFKVNPSNIKSVCEKIMLLESFCDIEVKKINPDFNGEFLNDGKNFYLKGALTYSRVENIGKDVENIFINDITKVFLDYKSWKSLISRYKVYFTLKANLLNYVINLYDINKEEFEKNFEEKTLKKFLYNPYEYRKIQ